MPRKKKLEETKTPRSPRSFVRKNFSTLRSKKKKSTPDCSEPMNVVHTPREKFVAAISPRNVHSASVGSIDDTSNHKELPDSMRRLTISPEAFKELDNMIMKQPVRGRSCSHPSKPIVEEDPLAEIRKKIQQEEELLETQREAVRNFSGGDKQELADLKESIAERLMLISALRQNLTLSNEFLVTNGYTKVRKDKDDDFKQYWTVIAYPKLQFFHTESVRSAIEFYLIFANF